MIDSLVVRNIEQRKTKMRNKERNKTMGNFQFIFFVLHREEETSKTGHWKNVNDRREIALYAPQLY